MTQREEFRLYMKAANDTPGNHGDGHLNEAQMLAYCRGEISAPEREAAEAHLVDCESCIALFRSARDFLEPASENEAIGEAEMITAWQTTWSRAREEDSVPAEAAMVNGIQRERSAKPGLAWMAPRWRPALAFILLALIAGGLIYWFSKPGNKTPEQAQQEPPTTAPDKPPATAQQEQPSTTNPPSPSVPDVNEGVLAINIKARPSAGFEDSATRGERENAARASLVTARKMFLDVTGHKATSGLLRNRLDERLHSGARFLLTADRNEAEVALKIEAEAPPDAARISFTARVVGPDGKTLWPIVPGVIARRYQGQPGKAADRLLNDLLDDIQRIENKR